MIEDKDIIYFCKTCNDRTEHLYQSSQAKANIYTCVKCRFTRAILKAYVRRNQLDELKLKNDFPPLVAA